MKTKISLLALVIFLFAGCNEDDIQLSQDGVYTGIFYQTNAFALYQTSDVTIALKGGKFGGVSTDSQYPAICSGSYSTESKQIIFSNECVFTADFDGSLVLDGTYEIGVVQDSDSLYLVQNLGGQRYNIFRLTRE